MEFIAEILVEVVFMLGIALFGWCVRHKNITLGILAVALVVVDVIVLIKFGVLKF